MKKKTNKTATMTYRQGDVLLIPVKEIPTKGLVAKHANATLALGEATGHHHTTDQKVTAYYSSDTEVLASYFETETPVNLVHQEHNPVNVPPGKYRAVIQSEYTPEELKRVAD